MKLPVQFLAEARSELATSAEWYERRRVGLGVDFLAKVRGVVNRIGERPEAHADIYGDVRKAVVARFPYIVLYREEAGQVLVISVYHTSRNSSDWKSRV